MDENRRTITVTELNRRATLRKQGRLPRHVETYEQYMTRLEWYPEGTNPPQILPYAIPTAITQDLITKGVFLI